MAPIYIDLNCTFTRGDAAIIGGRIAEMLIETSADRNSHPPDQREGGCDFYLHEFQWEFDIIIYPPDIHL